VLFSEPKIPQFHRSILDGIECGNCFSALQRAENSSIMRRREAGAGRVRFQCSSASRKFLNTSAATVRGTVSTVSVLFSEPKIPQFSMT